MVHDLLVTLLTSANILTINDATSTADNLTVNLV